MRNPSNADADLSPDQNLLVPVIVATAIQLSYFLSVSLITKKSHTIMLHFVFILIK